MKASLTATRSFGFIATKTAFGGDFAAKATHPEPSSLMSTKPPFPTTGISLSVRLSSIRTEPSIWRIKRTN